MSEIGARFVKILRDLLIRDIRKLLRTIVNDLKNSQVNKQYSVIFQLVEGAILVTRLVTDYRKCKDCPLFASCPARAEIPLITDVHY